MFMLLIVLLVFYFPCQKYTVTKNKCNVATVHSYSILFISFSIIANKTLQLHILIHFKRNCPEITFLTYTDAVRWDGRGGAVSLLRAEQLILSLFRPSHIRRKPADAG